MRCDYGNMGRHKMIKILLSATFLLLGLSVRAQVNNPTLIFVTTAPTGSCTVPTPLQSVISTGSLYSCQAGTWAQIGSGGGGSGTAVANEFVLTAAGSQTFATNLNSEFPFNTCYVKSGSTTFTLTPVDANHITFTASGATDTVCNFSPGGAMAPDFAFTVTPSMLTFVPSMTGTQTPTFAIAQTALNGYTGTATYSTTGLASGMSSSYSPTTITGTGASTLSVSFPVTQASGLTTITTSATDGTHTHTNPVSLAIADTNTDLIEGWPISGTFISGNTFLDAISTNNFTAQNFTLTTVAGFPNQMAVFNGSSTSNATAANNTLTNFTGSTPFSIVDWFTDTTSPSSEDALLSTLDPSNNFIGWELGTLTQGGTCPCNLVFFLVNDFPSNAIEVASSGANTRDGNLHQAVVTYSGSQHAANVAFYLDGIPLSNSTPSSDTLTSSTANTKPITIAGRSDGSIPQTGGDGFVRIYSDVLSAGDVAAMFAAGPK
jgi:hypothetical protein